MSRAYSSGEIVQELSSLPQLVAATDIQTRKRAVKLFSSIAPKTIEVTLKEAELAKLFSNAWRYIQFAAANQFYMMSEKFGAELTKLDVRW